MLVEGTYHVEDDEESVVPVEDNTGLKFTYGGEIDINNHVMGVAI